MKNTVFTAILLCELVLLILTSLLFFTVFRVENAGAAANAIAAIAVVFSGAAATVTVAKRLNS